MKRVCVFCGSSVGVRPEYAAAAHGLGEALARRGLGLVYGGSAGGLMGAVADAALAAGGEAIALPGGLGTLEELFEVWTWALLGVHQMPLGLLDVASYYAPLVAFVDHAVREGFVRGLHRGMLLVDGDANALLDAFAAHIPPDVPRWLGEGST